MRATVAAEMLWIPRGRGHGLLLRSGGTRSSLARDGFPAVAIGPCPNKKI
ncbi:MAG TPA: hypothetical protein VFL63_01890 [Rhodanobacteraceae bacterium]|jgi:hypothetical protein|nr:hypothetical protein [Rhodanobacteraceae bacterium]